MAKIRVGVVGCGTIGKRVADAVRKQEDMELVGVNANSYNYRIIAAARKGIALYAMSAENDFGNNGVKVAGLVDDLMKKVDVVVDTRPKKVGKEMKEKYYIPNKLKAIFQGGEKPGVAEVSFTAQCNYEEAVGKDFVRVVSCNTTGLARTLFEVHKKWGVKEVNATMIRRGADPWDIRHGPINSIVPVLELPSHHGPDVRTVLPIEIFTTALSVSTTLMHVHTLIVECEKQPNVADAIEMWEKATRIKVLENAVAVRSTAEIMEYAKDLARDRGDMPEIVVWKEAIGAYQNKLLYMQAVHQESDVIPDNIDAIRAVMGFADGKKSIAMTNKALGIE